MPESVPLPASAKAEAQEALSTHGNAGPGGLSIDLAAVLLALLLAILVKLGLRIGW